MRRRSRRPPVRLLVAALVLAPALVVIPAAPFEAEAEACALAAGARLTKFALGNQQPYFYYVTEGLQGTLTVDYDLCEHNGAHVEADYDTPPLSTDPNPPTAPGDYTRKTDTVVWDIEPELTGWEQDVKVQTTQDALVEAAAEPIDVRITEVRGGTTGAPLRAPMFIVDDDGASRARFVTSSLSSPENVTSLTLPLLRAGPTSGTVGYEITGASPGADPADDLTTAPTGTVTWEGRLGKINVGVRNDTVPEDDDTFEVTLTGSGVTIVEPSKMTFTITDDDTVKYTLAVNKDGTGTGTVTSSPAGIDCGPDCVESYLKDTTVTLTAAPDPGSAFAGWTGGGCTGTGTCNVLMNMNKTVTATFTKESTTAYTLTVQREGSGTVTSNPAGISCGSDCSEPYAPDTTVTLTAQAASGWEFVGWTGGGCTGSTSATCDLLMNADKTVTATFEQVDATTYTLTAGLEGGGAGIITSSPAGISCLPDCSEAYAPDTTVTLTATAGTDSIFDGWNGCPAPSGNKCTVTMNGSKSVTATFSALLDLVVVVPDPSKGTVTSSPAGISCGTDCTHQYKQGTSVTLTVTPATGYTFMGWTGPCSGIGTTCSFGMENDQNVGAAFEDVTAPLTSFHHPRHQKTYKFKTATARFLHMYAPTESIEPSGIAKAHIALMRKKKNGSCQWWNGASWVPGGGCGNAKRWSNRLPTEYLYDYNGKGIYEHYLSKDLKPSMGTKIKFYIVYSMAQDGAGNWDNVIETGRNKNKFEIKK